MQIINVWAVGRNYSEHAKELGNSVPTEPMIFLKSGSSIATENQEIRLPSFSNDVHHEIEIAVQFDSNLDLARVGLAIDFTARDLQAKLKAASHPWTLAKSYKQSCALSHLIPLPSISEIENYKFELKVNGIEKQQGHGKDMIFKVPQLADYVRSRFPVMPGDLLLTGTPSGVSRVQPGDVLEAEIKGRLKAKWTLSQLTF